MVPHETKTEEPSTILKSAKAKKDKPQLVASDLKAPVPSIPATEGHNSTSTIIPGVVALFEEIEATYEPIKALQKIQKDCRNRLKTEFNISKRNVADELRMRKLDRDVRIQIESGAHDLKEMLGYQASLDLAANTVARTEEEYVDPSAVANKLINRVR